MVQIHLGGSGAKRTHVLLIHKWMVGLVVLGMVSSASQGCAEATKPTWHQKFDWQAEAYFDDKQVIALCKAIEADDVKEIDRLVKAGADVNAKGKDNVTPLLWAFPAKDPQPFTRLLELGADPDVYVTTDVNTKGIIRPGDSVTILAARSPVSERFGAVMEHDGDPNGTNPISKETVISTIVQFGGAAAKERVKLLVEKGVDLNRADGSGVPPVIDAVSWFSQFDLALLMLEAGADYGKYVENQNSKLIHAVLSERPGLKRLTPQQRADHAKLLKWLVDKGESVEDAEADLERWKSWHALPISEIGKRRLAEIAARKAREKAQ
jgi:hypothetical protein